MTKFKICPVEPTEEMLDAADEVLHKLLREQAVYSLEKLDAVAYASEPILLGVYKAMLADCQEVDDESIGTYSTRTGALKIYNHRQLQNDYGLKLLPIYTTPQPDKVAELEAKLKVAVDALKLAHEHAKLHSLTYYKGHNVYNSCEEALKQIGSE